MFFVFQLLIIQADDELSWKLTMLIKDVLLSDAQIEWLIDNYKESEHIQNRLLRYPVINFSVSKWAGECIQNGDLENRLSELIGLQLNFDESYKHHNGNSFAWGIHYSQLNIEIKRKLLIKNLNNGNLVETVKILERNVFNNLPMQQISRIFTVFISK